MIDDPELVACEPARYVCETDPLINKYCSALITKTPFKDPFAFFLAKNASLQNIKGIYKADKYTAPYIANGVIIRKNIIQKVGGFDYDIDTALRMIEQGYNKFARLTNVGIYHSFVLNFSDVTRKSITRFSRFLQFHSHYHRPATRVYFSPDKSNWLLIAYQFLKALTIIIPLIYAVRMFKIEREYAWFYHPFVLFLVAIIYLILIPIKIKQISILQS